MSLELLVTVNNKLYFMSFVNGESPATFALPDEKNVLEIQTQTEKAVKEALSLGNWDALRALSLLPGGFGDGRVEAWYVLWNGVVTMILRFPFWPHSVMRK